MIETVTPLIFFAVVLLGPAVALTLLRVNAAVVFLSLCLGSVLVQFMGNDARQLCLGLFAARQQLQRKQHPDWPAVAAGGTHHHLHVSFGA